MRIGCLCLVDMLRPTERSATTLSSLFREILSSHVFRVSKLVSTVEDVLKNDTQWSPGGFLDQARHFCEGSQMCVKLRGVAGNVRVGIGLGGST